MDGLDPYNNDYTGYEPEYTGSPETSGKSSKPDAAAEQVQTPGALPVFDPRRLSEVPLTESLATAYSATSRGRTNEVPVTTYHADPNRISLHPLGIVERPAGVAGANWSALDRDGLLVRPVEIGSLGIALTAVAGETGEGAWW